MVGLFLSKTKIRLCPEGVEPGHACSMQCTRHISLALGDNLTFNVNDFSRYNQRLSLTPKPFRNVLYISLPP